MCNILIFTIAETGSGRLSSIGHIESRTSSWQGGNKFAASDSSRQAAIDARLATSLSVGNQ